MPTFIALLRGINVAGRNMISMSDLLDLAKAIGLKNPRTLLQSGNLVFDSRRSAAALERSLETETTARVKRQIHYCVRTANEWASIVASNPFPTQAQRDPARLVVMCLKSAPQMKHLKALQTAIQGPETIQLIGKELYITYPIGIGRSKLTNNLIERQLEVRGTARNWNTVLKIAALTAGK